MDSMIQYYMEETEDMLQKAEECLIRLESEYSSDDVNELFRIAHTIKGSSHLAGYEDIGNIMHKIEDMLDCARNGSILFDQSIASLCFEGLDIVKKMLQCKKDPESQEMTDGLVDDVSRISEMIDALIHANKREETKAAAKQPEMGIVSSLLSKKPEGRNKYYITFFIEEDAPMVSPVVMMILKGVEEIGTLVYSSVTDGYFSDSPGDQEIRALDIILSTDVEEAELYTYFALSYVDRINIVDLTRSRLEESDYSFNNSDNDAYMVILGVFAKLCNMLCGGPEGKKIRKEALPVIENLHSEAVSAFNKIKNKKRIRTFIKDFNEFISLVAETCGGDSDIDEELYSNIRTQMVKLLERANNFTKGKYVLRVFKPEKNNFIDRLKNFIVMVNKASTLSIAIDLSKLNILHENEVKALVEIKKQLEKQGIELGIIAVGSGARRIINIFDSIKPVEEFNIFKSELDALLRMIHSQDSFHKIAEKIRGVQYEI